MEYLYAYAFLISVDIAIFLQSSCINLYSSSCSIVLKNKEAPYPTAYTEINLKWIKDLKLSKLLEENLHDVRFDKDFLDMTPKAQATKAKNR